ncbi:MAG: fused response regulator/thioredoxin-disulfide reductase, partial [Ginsengibacter sp.]
MKLPFIIIVDDDAQVLRAISRDVKAQYSAEYKVISTDSAMEAIEVLTDLKNSGDVVALFLVDQRMP